MKNFALIGAAGYVAPRHMQAVKDIGGNLVAAFDPNDSVGIIDNYFPEAHFFTEFERFDRHIDKLRRRQEGQAVDYVSICSPNYLHDSHIRFALRSNADAICEKPLVLNPWNIDALQFIEKDTGRKVYTVLQLRLHPAVINLKKEVAAAPADKKFDIDLTYIASRGKWYDISWKGDEKKSGGVVTNIGVHFYDMLHFVFGKVQQNVVHFMNQYKAAGFIEYEKARVRWFLSVDNADVPLQLQQQGQRTCRILTINGNEIDFSDNFTNLHTRVYQEVLAGNGFGLEENRVAIEIAGSIRSQTPVGITGDYHPFLSRYK
ncbi:MAG TPA: Gfo/Idh/MocA family oxidoreductase [Ferruginibacter sp.]|nr:Gfo/Idh/MocA family oxidoreductase [Ferruginibacter sp.]HMP19653.1 Gfo/Idh/MocA family oxidoreductase [Ferruginibacter sp.]